MQSRVGLTRQGYPAVRGLEPMLVYRHDAFGCNDRPSPPTCPPGSPVYVPMTQHIARYCRRSSMGSSGELSGVWKERAARPPGVFRVVIPSSDWPVDGGRCARARRRAPQGDVYLKTNPNRGRRDKPFVRIAGLEGARLPTDHGDDTYQPRGRTAPRSLAVIRAGESPTERDEPIR